MTGFPGPRGGSSLPRLLRGLRPTLRIIGRQRTYPDPSGWLPDPVGNPQVVPTFTMRSIDQLRAWLYPGSFATATPQTFTMASPPTELNGFGVQTPSRSTLGQRLVHCTPAHIRQVGARLRNYGASNTSSLTLHLLISLDRPALSGSASTSRPCQGRLPPSPALPGSGCPQLHQAAATTQRGWSLTTPRHT